MRSLWDPMVRSQLSERMGRLTPEHRAQWGQFTAPRMVAHVADGLRMAIGELTAVSKRVPLRYPPLKQLFVYWLPFPKGAPTAPELLARAPGDLAREVVEVRLLLERFAARDRLGPWPEHPSFGQLSARAWAVGQYKHIDHHLRQFGE